MKKLNLADLWKYRMVIWFHCLAMILLLKYCLIAPAFLSVILAQLYSIEIAVREKKRF